ncbi:MAG: tetratricopeptide repeat protein [Nitrospirae bacterium]|nr:MAG: tetratricopeptide repeat protein [Nitrospirota bacterium]
MNRICLVVSLVLLLSISIIVEVAAVPAVRAGIQKDAEIIAVRGEGWVRFIRQADWEAALQSQALTAGDAVRTGALGKMDLLFADGAQIKVHQKTTIQIKEVGVPGSGKGSLLGLDVGEVWSRTRPSKDGLRIKTPSATAAIRGTDWDLLVEETGTSHLLVLKGQVELYNDLGSVSVGPGEQAVSEVGKAPVKTFLVRPKDRVQWIISYPLEIADIVVFTTLRRPDAVRAVAAARARAGAPGGTLALAELLYDVRERSESLKLTREVLAAEPGNSRALLLLGFLQLAEGRADDAGSAFNAALEHAKGLENIRARLGLAGVQLQKGAIAAAGGLIQELAADAAYPEPGIALAQFHAFQGDFTGAVQVCERYAARFPADERFPVMIADFSTTLDDTVRAEAAMRSALSINPNSAEALSVHGRQYYLSGRSSEAEASYRRALALDPAHTRSMSELGKLLMEKGHFEESYEQLSEALRREPRVSSSWSKRGMLMNWIENLPSSGKDLARATELNPGDYQSLTGLGVIALKEGRTREAVQYFLKAGLMDANYAEPHIFLAIAHYQLAEIDQALEELRLAAALDPKDPVPHIITYIIYQDTYRPMQAVEEATKALELLPNLKSVNPTQDTKRGLSNLGSALLGLGMDEWAGSYAEESFDLFDSASYRFVSNRFADNPAIYLSANMQSFLLNPMSIGFNKRYQDIVLKPQHNFIARTELGFEQGHPATAFSLIQEGFVRKPFEIDYLIQLDTYKNDGFRGNGYSRGYFLTYALGGRPDYKNGFFVYGAVTGDRFGDPGPIDRPDLDDFLKKRSYSVTAGYNKRLGPKSNLLFAFQQSETTNRYHNPDPLGVTVPDAVTASFIKSFGFDGASHVYNYLDIQFNDPLDILAAPPLSLSPITAGLPRTLDVNSRSLQKVQLKSDSVHAKHISEINEDHQLSIGIERTRHHLEVSEIDTLRTDFTDSYFYADLPTDSVKAIPLYANGTFPSTSVSQSGTTTIAYIDDRWKISGSLLLEAGLFYELYRDEINEIMGLHPRLGISWRFHRNHILRVAAQKRLLPVDPTLSPFTTAGVGFTYPRSQAFPGDTITDYQAGIESKWTDRLYSEIRVERRYHRWQKTRTLFQDQSFFDREDVNNRADLVSAALNLIISDRLGAFARYTNTNNKNISGRAILNPVGFEVPLTGRRAQYEPDHLFAAGIVYVSPRYLKAALSARYVSSQFVDDDNTYSLPGYWTTDLKVTGEFYKKHLQVVLDLTNLFDSYRETAQKIPGPGRSVYLTLEYRF